MPENQTLHLCFQVLWEQGTQPSLRGWNLSEVHQNYIPVTAFIMNVCSFIPSFEVIPVGLRTKQCVTFMVELDQHKHLVGQEWYDTAEWFGTCKELVLNPRKKQK